MSDELIFKKDSEDFFQRIVTLFKEDKFEQEKLMNFFKTEPPEFRERMKDIEALAMGLKIQDDGSYFNNNTKSNATESELEKLNEETDRAMLRQNPNFLKFKMRHDGGFIVPTDLEKRRQEFKDSPNKFKRRAF